MTESLNPAASHHLPAFITAPGDTDILMVITAIVLVLCILAFGILFLRLHTLPERMAHKSQKIQFEIVAVLGLLALFTHIHAFWVAGLLLALIVTAHRHRKAKADDQGQQGQRAGKHGVEIRALVFFERANLSAKKVTGECGAPLRDEGDRENRERIVDNRAQAGIRMLRPR